MLESLSRGRHWILWSFPEDCPAMARPWLPTRLWQSNMAGEFPIEFDDFPSKKQHAFNAFIIIYLFMIITHLFPRYNHL